MRLVKESRWTLLNLLVYCSHSLFLTNHGWISAWITSLPKSQVYDVILFVVDRLTKFVHFMPLSHPYTATMVSQVFMTTVFKLHDLPRSIVSDRDAAFTPTFWKELFKLQGSKLAMSSTYHPQSDG